MNRIIAKARRRRSGFFLLTLLLLLAPSLQAEPRVGLLYQVNRAGEPPSYLFGTMHSNDPRVLALLEQAKPVLGSADRLVMEMVPDAAAVLTAAARLLIQDGPTLDQLLEPELYQQVLSLGASKGIPELVLKQLKPWALAVMFSMPEGTGGNFLDLQLYQLALSRKLPVLGLETVAEQLAVFDQAPEEIQVGFLRDAVEHHGEMPQQLESLVQAYLSRDLEQLKALSEEQERLMNDELAAWFDDTVVEQRNQRMFERLLDLLDGGGAFVAVGALHLAGESGLVKTLANAGYQLTVVY